MIINCLTPLHIKAIKHLNRVLVMPIVYKLCGDWQCFEHNKLDKRSKNENFIIFRRS